MLAEKWQFMTSLFFYFQVWDFESIDNADSQDESKLFEIEPMSELKVSQNFR